MSCLLLLLLLSPAAAALAKGSRCHFIINEKAIYLKPLQIQPYYQYRDRQNPQLLYLYNFCSSFHSPASYNCGEAFSMVVNTTDNSCLRYSGSGQSSGFDHSIYIDQEESGVILREVSDERTHGQQEFRSTEITIICSNDEGFKVKDIESDQKRMDITGYSKYGCPVLDGNRLWVALSQHTFVFGLVCFLVGLVELFYGRKILNPTIFVAAYILSFVLLGVIASDLIIRPDSSEVLVYFMLIFVVLGSSCIAYLATSMARIPVLLIGAQLGFILALLINTLIAKLISGLQNGWSLFVLAVVLCVGFALLAGRYYDQIVIASSSTTGAYLVVRPISWIFGGFPNELVLADRIKSHLLTDLSATFYVYLLLIIILALVGGYYQFIKLRRERAQIENALVEVGSIEGKLEGGVDAILAVSIDRIIKKYTEEPQEQKKPLLVELHEIPVLSPLPLSNPHTPNRASSRSSESPTPRGKHLI